MVGIVLVSHSRALAEAVLEMVQAMTGKEAPFTVAAGTGEGHRELGTDATEIYEAVRSVHGPEGVLVLMDIGSAVLSAETALDLLEEEFRINTKLCPCPFVEGAVAAGVSAKIGSSLDEVYREAVNALAQKKESITSEGELPAQQPVPNAPTLGGEKITLKMPIPAGLHARPVVNLIKEAAKYDSDITISNVTTRKGPVSLRSMTAVISLEILYGQELELSASGPDAKEALTGLKAAIISGLGDALEPTVEAKPQLLVNSVTKPAVKGSFKPVGISKGFAIGPAFYPGDQTPDIPDHNVEDVQGEISILQRAVSDASSDLTTESAALAAKGDKIHSELSAAHAAMVSDPELLKKAGDFITGQKYNAAYAWNKAVEEARQQFLGLGDENLRLRAMDLEDVGNAVLRKLGIESRSILSPQAPSVMIVDEITPDQVAGLDINKVLGVICIHNGPTSHSSILLGSRGIPSIVQAANSGLTLTGLPASTVIAMDGGSGEIWIDPDTETTAEINRLKAEYEKGRAQDLEAGKSPAVTLDGVRIPVYANIGRPGDAQIAADNGADGVGLFRTEFMFLDRSEAPTEDEQFVMMRDILLPIRDKDIVVRTLDAGGDKELPYLGMPHEINPQLGVRAIRLSLLRPDLFLTQLRAILRLADQFRGLRIMFPLISMPGQLKQAKDYLEQAHRELEAAKVPHRWPVSTGMMMEVPSAAVMAKDYIPDVDFVSIGTNDLTQYTLAAERDNAYMQQFTTAGLDDAVIELIGNICKEAAAHGVEVSVCGETAADPASAAKLLGMGVGVLSMSPQSIPQTKSWIRRQTLGGLKNYK